MRTPRLTYSNVVATLALFVALGGGAYAGTQLPADSVGPAELSNGTVKPRHLSQALATKLAGASGSETHPPRSDDPCSIWDPGDSSCVNTPAEPRTLKFLASRGWTLKCPPGKSPMGVPYPAVTIETTAKNYTGDGTFNGPEILFIATNWSVGKQTFTPYIPCYTP